MRFVCDSCKTKYSIEDARVKGKVLKIRCKTCSNVITVREEPAAATAAAAASASGSPASKLASPTGPQPLSKALENSFQSRQQQDYGESSERTMISSSPTLPAPHEPEWYVSFDGEQEGPHSVEQAAARVRDEQTKGREAHAWRDGFDGWLPALEVPEILRAVRALAPRHAPTPMRTSPPVPAAAMRSPTPVASPRTTSSAATMHDMQAPVLAAVARSSNGTSPALAAKAVPMAKPAPVAVAAPQPHPVPTAVPQPMPVPVPVAPPTPVAVAPQPLPVPVPVPVPVKSEPIRVEAGIAVAAPATTAADQSTGGAGVDLFISEPSVFAQVPSSLLAPPAPVVIVAPGSAPAHSPWIRWFALGAGLTTLLLLGTVGYLLFIKPKPVVATVTPPPVTNPVKPLDDHPVALNEGPNRTTTTTPPPTPTDPKHAAVATKTGHSTKPSTTKSSTPAGLNKDQSALAALYASEDKTSEHSLPKTTTTERPSATVNQNEIYDVIRKNKQSLTMCYERVLKHDNSLKKGRVEVEVKVGVSGLVTKVSIPSSEFAGSDIGTCLSQAIRRWHFPSTGAEYEAGFPLILQAAN